MSIWNILSLLSVLAVSFAFLPFDFFSDGHLGGQDLAYTPSLIHDFGK